jgi:uncharacterized protein (TIGR02217 family)
LLGRLRGPQPGLAIALWKYEVSLTNRPIAEIQAFMAHVLGRRGAANTFPLRDPLDNTLTDENIGTGDGATASFQIHKTYADADRPYVRPITIVSSLVVKVAGVTKTVTTHYTQADGIVTFTGGNIPTAGQAMTVTCDWLIRVRYEQDYNPITFPVADNARVPVASAGPITLMERFVEPGHQFRPQGRDVGHAAHAGLARPVRLQGRHDNPRLGDRQDQSFNSQTWTADKSFKGSTLKFSGDGTVPDGEVTAPAAISDAYDSEDVYAGTFEGMEITLFMVSFNSPSDGGMQLGPTRFPRSTMTIAARSPCSRCAASCSGQADHGRGTVGLLPLGPRRPAARLLQSAALSR